MSMGTTSLFKQQPLGSRQPGNAVPQQKTVSELFKLAAVSFPFSLFSFLLLLLLREPVHKYVVTRGSNMRKEANFLPVSSLSCAVIEGEEASENYLACDIYGPLQMKKKYSA